MSKPPHGEGGGGGAHHAPVHREAARGGPHVPISHGHSETLGVFKAIKKWWNDAKEHAPNIPITLASLGFSAWLMGAPFNQAMVNAWSTGVEAKGMLKDLGIDMGGKGGGGHAPAHG